MKSRMESNMSSPVVIGSTSATRCFTSSGLPPMGRSPSGKGSADWVSQMPLIKRRGYNPFDSV